MEKNEAIYNRIAENNNKIPLTSQKYKKITKTKYLFFTLVSVIVILSLFIAASWVLVQEKFSEVNEKLQDVHAIEKKIEKFQKLEFILNQIVNTEKRAS